MDHVTHPRTAAIRDPRLPVLTELLNAPVPGPVRAALQAAGAEVQACRVASVSWSPGSSARVSYDVLIDPGAPGLEAGGWIGPVVVAAGRLPSGAFLVGDGEQQVAVWRVPHDPGLPGLPSAVDPRTAGDLLTALGQDGGPVQTRVRAYRPGRRAVVEITGRAEGLYLKVLRLGRAEAVHERHRWLAGHLPVTQSLGIDPGLGIVALQAMPGVTLREAMEDPQALLPTPQSLDSLLQRLPDPARADVALSPVDRVADAAAAVAQLLPETADLAAELAARIGTRDGVAADRAVHGDFYEGQILIEGSAISGLIDLDTYGWGRPGDDHATMLGHLSVYQGMSPQQLRIAQYGGLLLAEWEGQVAPGELRRRTAATVLSLAPGAFRAQGPTWPEELQRRLELALAWIESAEAAGYRHGT